MTALLCIRSYSSSVQRIVIVLFLFRIFQPPLLPFRFCRDAPTLRLSVRFDYVEAPLGAAPRRGGSGFAPTSKRSADCRMRCWHFILPLPVLLRQRYFSPYANAAHTRSTLRDNRFHRRRWDNYPIWTAAAKMGAFVRDSNSAVTVTLPTREPTDTPRR